MYGVYSLCILCLAAAQVAAEYSQPYVGSNFARTFHWRKAAHGKHGVFLMNRIGPSSSELYISNIDGTNERNFLADSKFEYVASFSPDSNWVTFTTERNGDGNSDIYRSRLDGSGMEKIVATPSFEHAVALSPNGTKAAYVSTADGYKANVWVLDLESGDRRSLTSSREVAGDPRKPDGYFRPSWSPDGQWIAFSSDRNTAWRGHGNGTGWEHTQELSIYIIRPDGSGFRRLATKPEHCLGSPKWSPDGKRVVYYEVSTENTWDTRRPEGIKKVTSQIISVDVATGQDRIEHTSGPGLKLAPQFISQDEIGYHVKGVNEGLAYVSLSNNSPRASLLRELRNPSWSPDGKLVIYEKVDFTPRPMEKKLYSWDEDWEYRFTDVFPMLSRQGRLAITQKQLGTSSIVTMRPNGQDAALIFDTITQGKLDNSSVARGTQGAFQPTWSPDGEWIAFGLGAWFQGRAQGKARILRSTSNGSYFEVLTDGSVHSGFPSYSADGRFLVFREWGEGHFGLRIMDLADKSVRKLTNEPDNLPMWSPDGSRILFSRKVTYTNFDVCTIKPDGTDVRCLTDSGANDAHAVWTADGRIMYSTGMYGFREEAAVYDQTFQPYGQIMIMEADGSGKKMLTDSMWEDSMPLFVPNEYLE